MRAKLITAAAAGLLVIGLGVNPLSAPAGITTAPDDRGTGRAETCALDASSGCTINHGFGEKPTAVTVTNGGTTFVAVDPNLTTAISYRVVFRQMDGTLFAAGINARFNAHFDFGPVDNVAPDTTISSSPAASTNSASASFEFVATEANSTFECKLDSSTFAACTSPKAYSGLADGGHAFEVRAIDPNGNTDATPATHPWAIDTIAPDTTISSAPPASTEDADASFEFTSEAGATFECKLDSGTFAACASPKAYSGLAVGGHSFQVRASDALGNVDTSPAAHNWEITAPPPAPPALRPSWQSSGTPALTFQDEFNDTVVDTTKWQRGWFKESGLSDNVNSSNDNCYHSNQVSESGGYLHLVAIEWANTCKGVTRPYTSGMVTTYTKFDQHRGAFEARVCLPDADGNGLVDNFPAWWVNGMDGGFQDGEIDVVEGLGGGRTKATVHYGSSHLQAGKYSTSPLAGCHNFGVEWRGDNVKFYWDGVLHFDTAFVVDPSEQLVLVLNQAVDDSHSPTVVPAGGNDMSVDWVRVWE